MTTYELKEKKNIENRILNGLLLKKLNILIKNPPIKLID